MAGANRESHRWRNLTALKAMESFGSPLVLTALSAAFGSAFMQARCRISRTLLRKTS
jgi:hypothetical protein